MQLRQSSLAGVANGPLMSCHCEQPVTPPLLRKGAAQKNLIVADAMQQQQQQICNSMVSRWLQSHLNHFLLDLSTVGPHITIIRRKTLYRI
jgi:hypothetical protein